MGFTVNGIYRGLGLGLLLRDLQGFRVRDLVSTLPQKRFNLFKYGRVIYAPKDERLPTQLLSQHVDERLLSNEEPL